MIFFDRLFFCSFLTNLGTSNQRTLTSLLFYPDVISNETVDCEMEDEKDVFVNSYLMDVWLVGQEGKVKRRMSGKLWLCSTMTDLIIKL